MTGKKYLTLENVSAGISVIWGGFIVNPFVTTFSKVPQLYAPMEKVTTNEVFWGGLYVAAGIAALALSYFARQASAALLMAIVLILLGTLFFLGDPESQGWGVYGFLGLCNFIRWRAIKWATKYSG